jgi:outer membrane autotransporter protein
LLAVAPSVTVDAGATLDYTGIPGLIVSLLGAGTVVNPAGLQVTGNSNFAGTIAGAGGLTLFGGGTTTLTGTNTYTGGTTIAPGTTLTLGAGGSIVGSVANFGNFNINSGGTVNLSGTLSSGIAASQTTLGGGTLRAATTSTVTDNVSFASATTSTLSAAAGQTLTVNSNFTVNANAGMKFGSATDTGTVVFEPTTVAAAFPGTQTYEVVGGTWRAGNSLGVNGFTSQGHGLSTTVDAGATLDLNDFTTGVNTLLGAGQVTTGVNAATKLLLTGNGNFSGVIGGAGQVQIDSGTTVLTGTSTYSGGTTIIAGATLQLGNGGAGGSIAGNVVNNGTLAVNRSDTFTLANVISGTGAFQQNGTGTTVLTATNTYSGATTVNAGTLVVNGSIANSAVTVNAAATLAGIGTVGATKINSGGTFAPGNSPGTITVQGNLAFQSGAIYLVQVNPSTASSTNVTAGGNATLAGTVQAAFASGSYAARTYTILSAAGGLNGTTFNTLTTSNLPAGFTASLSYTATDAILNLTATLGQPSAPSAPGAPGGPSGPGALACAFSINQCNVANALNAFFNNGGALPPNFVTIFGLTGANLANALTLLSGEAATEAQQVGFQLTNQFLNVMLDPFVDGRSEVNGRAIAFAPEREELPDDIALAYAKILKEPPKPPSFEQRWSVWGAGYGGSNRTSGDVAVVGSHDLSASTAGGAAGLDYRLAPGTVVGFALAGGGTNWSLAQGIGGGKSDAFQAGVYGTARSGPAYLAAALAYTNHWMSTDRFAFAGDHLTASFNAQSFGGRVESGYRFATIYGGLTPYAAIQAQSFHTPGYTETDLNAGGFALGFNSRRASDTRSELGGRFDRLLLLNPEAALTLRARVAWAHDWISDPSLAAVFQTLPGASFVVNGATPAKNSALTSAGLEYRLANGVVLLAKFDGEFASHSSTYAGTGTVRYTW